MVPDGYMYTEDHLWVSRMDDRTVKVGITAYRVERPGEMVFVELPEVGEEVPAGDEMGEVEATMSTVSIHAPLDGEVLAVNDVLDAQSELVNSNPFSEGWFVELRPNDPASVTGLLDAAGYTELISRG
ncbi:glycine cleavage system protein GcvH [Streptomyces sp. NPDC002669]|uniref:glycine cleavage system protein GcvH n=1 Tax=Streptomyces sp. NPDC002669 TaxID=3364658 RepID=UPI0036C968C6